MNRSTIDKLISSTAVVVAIALLAASGGLFYAYNFIHGQVHDQLAEQHITFPAAGSPAIEALSTEDKQAVSKYAGQQLVTGAQAKVFADNYIAAHLEKAAGGKTYAEASTASRADPSNAELKGQVETLFRGETLRGLLLNAYAFDTMAVVARFAAIGALIASLILFILAGLGFVHANTAQAKTKKRR